VSAPYLDYAHGVVGGTIPAGRYVVQACQRFLDDLAHGSERGLVFRSEQAEYVVRFFGLLRHSKGEWAGQPFVLSPWEAFCNANIFGWYRADGTRRFRVVWVEVPRKNGKSTYGAGLGLTLTVADGEPGAEIYSAATKRDQARIVHGEAVRMVKASPGLRKRIKINRDNLHVPATNSKYTPLGADADTMDGLNVHGAIVDEVHAHRTRDVVDVLDTATAARRQPLLIYLTTAGFDRASVCWELHEYGIKVLQDRHDDEWFVYIACADETDKWNDPATWAKANPNLGVSVKVSDLQRKATKAEASPGSVNAFRRLHTNLWTESFSPWLSAERWASCARQYQETALHGHRCYGGLDLSAVSDLTAWALVFPVENELRVLCRTWCPSARLHAADNRYRAQYELWRRQGWLKVTPGDAVDYAFVKAAILQDATTFALKDFNVDRLFQSHQLMMELADEGVVPIPMGMSTVSLAVPMKEYERRVLDATLVHDGNPVLAWAVSNVVTREDPQGNLRPDRKESQGKIDPFMAVLMALDRAIRYEERPPTNPYEAHGVRYV
jgi:phage terminase large subunit-like protein